MSVFKQQHYIDYDAPAQAHSPTSVAAAKSQKPKKTEIDREKILVALAKHGPLTDEQWHHLTLHGAKPYDDGTWGMSYDPGIGIPFQKGPLADIDLSGYWDAVRCPTLLLRGAQSDLLSIATAQQMTQCGPKAQLVEFAGVGHAPTLIAPDQVDAVANFVLAA